MDDQSIILRTQAQIDLAVKVIGRINPDPEHPLEVLLRRHKKKRSLEQNALYWSWLGIISRHTGNDTEQLHEAFKQRFAEAMVADVFGKTVTIYSTAKMKVGEMSEYLDRVFAFAASEGIVLPLPEDRIAA